MKKKYKRVRADSRTIKNRSGEGMEPILKKYKKRYDESASDIDIWTDWAEEHNENINHKNYLKKVEQRANSILVNSGLPLDIKSSEFKVQYDKSNVQPFDDEEIARQLLSYIEDIRIAEKNNNINFAIYSSLLLGQSISHFNIKQLERSAVIGREVINSKKSKADIAAMKEEAKNVFDSLPEEEKNKQKKARTTIYNKISESTGSEFSREHIRSLLSSYLSELLGNYAK